MSFQLNAFSLAACGETSIFGVASQRAHSHVFNLAGSVHPVAGLPFDSDAYALAELEDLIAIHCHGQPEDLAAYYAARDDPYVPEPDDSPDEDDEVYVADEPVEDG